MVAPTYRLRSPMGSSAQESLDMIVRLPYYLIVRLPDYPIRDRSEQGGGRHDRSSR